MVHANKSCVHHDVVFVMIDSDYDRSQAKNRDIMLMIILLNLLVVVIYPDNDVDFWMSHVFCYPCINHVI